MIQDGVAALEKDLAIPFELLLVLDHVGCSEFFNIALPDHLEAND
jgi:hypothetical protein